MKKNKYLAAILFIVVLAAVFFWLSKSRSETEPSTKAVNKTIAFVVPTMSNPFFVDMVDAAKQKSADIGGVDIIVKAPQNVEDALTQNQIVENLITQHVDAICIVPTNSESIIPVLKKANDANIPIINIDNKINFELANKQNAKISTYIGSDNFDGGVLAGEYITEKLNGNGKVAILEGISGNDAAIKRKAGFLEAINKTPGIEVVSSQVANWDREQGMNIFQNILKANPDLNAVFACNDEMALGAYAALKQNKTPKEKIVIVGFDAIDEAVKAVKEGRLDATIAQQPKLMGENGVQLALDILSGKNVDSMYSTELKVIKR